MNLMWDFQAKSNFLGLTENMDCIKAAMAFFAEKDVIHLCKFANE